MNKRATIIERENNYLITFHEHGLELTALDQMLKRVIHLAEEVQVQSLEPALEPSIAFPGMAEDLVAISQSPYLEVVDMLVAYAGGGQGIAKNLQMQVPRTYIADVATFLGQDAWDLQTEEGEFFEAPVAERLVDICSDPSLSNPVRGIDYILTAEPFCLARYSEQPNARKFDQEPSAYQP
tara:strand:+ start:4752 stop:5294 length:543 start_codon:yes stop_codon:yes gene_type:complete